MDQSSPGSPLQENTMGYCAECGMEVGDNDYTVPNEGSYHTTHLCIDCLLLQAAYQLRKQGKNIPLADSIRNYVMEVIESRINKAFKE